MFGFQLPYPPSAQMLFRRPVDALVGQAAVVHSRRVAVLLEVGVLYLGPPLPGFQEPLFRSGAVLPATPQFGMFPVVPLEVLLWVSVEAIHRPFRVHQVDVRLFAARQRRAGIVDRPLMGVPLPDLVLDEVQDQGVPLLGIQLARQSEFEFSVGRAVRPFVPVGGGPEEGRLVFGPRRQVAVPGRLQVFVARPLGVTAFAGDVGSVPARLALAADFDAAMVGGHVGMPRWSGFASLPCRCAAWGCFMAAG